MTRMGSPTKGLCGPCLQVLDLAMLGCASCSFHSKCKGILPRLQLCGCKAIERDLVVRGGEVGWAKEDTKVEHLFSMIRYYLPFARYPAMERARLRRKMGSEALSVS